MKNKVKEKRELLGMTQEDLSKKAGVARTIISGLESGKRTVTTTATMQKIAKALNEKITELFF